MAGVSALVSRFPQHELVIHRLWAREGEFRAVCGEYEAALAALRHWESLVAVGTAFWRGGDRPLNGAPRRRHGRPAGGDRRRGGAGARDRPVATARDLPDALPRPPPLRRSGSRRRRAARRHLRGLRHGDRGQGCGSERGSWTSGRDACSGARPASAPFRPRRCSRARRRSRAPSPRRSASPTAPSKPASRAAWRAAPRPTCRAMPACVRRSSAVVDQILRRPARRGRAAAASGAGAEPERSGHAGAARLAVGRPRRLGRGHSLPRARHRALRRSSRLGPSPDRRGRLPPRRPSRHAVCGPQRGGRRLRDQLAAPRDRAGSRRRQGGRPPSLEKMAQRSPALAADPARVYRGHQHVEGMVEQLVEGLRVAGWELATPAP